MATLPVRNFADLLRHHRLAAGLSQEALAERAGLSARGVSDLERGVNRVPQRATVLRLADALALTTEARTAFEAVVQYSRATAHAAEVPVVHLPSLVPVPLTPLLGRAEELQRLRALLLDDQTRLVTLTGVGGVGKTQLALAAAAALAAAFPDGVIFVPLADLRDAQVVPAALAQHVGLHAGGGDPLLAQVIAYLASKKLLLVIDNFEHLLPAAPALATILERCPQVKMLITSRARLHLRGEREGTVEPLALPDLRHLPPLAVLAHSPAVALFLARVAEHRPDFRLSTANAAAVAAVCVRLEGLPLALELAAAQSRLFSPRALLARLDRRLSVLTGGPADLPARQLTIAATIDWSYNLLSAGEQSFFRRLSVFAGGCTLDAIEAACKATSAADDAVLAWLRALVDSSLVRQIEMPDEEVRFSMLDTIRAYALDLLTREKELAVVCQAHAGYFAHLAAATAPALRGADQAACLARLEAEHDNFRAALQWTIREGGDRPLGLQLACDLGAFWTLHGHYREGSRWLLEALAGAPTAAEDGRATALNHLGNLVYWLGDLAQAREAYDASLAVRRAQGDAPRVARGLLNLGNLAFEQQDYAGAQARYEEALAMAETAGDSETRVRAINNLGVLAEGQSDPRRALALFEDCVQVLREVGDHHSLAQVLTSIGDVTSTLGEIERAWECYRQSLIMRRDLDDRDGLRWTFHSLGFLAHHVGERAGAVRLLGATASLTEQLGAMLGSERQTLYDRHIAALQEELGQEGFAAMWAEGRAMDYEAAIDYALGLSWTYLHAG